MSHWRKIALFMIASWFTLAAYGSDMKQQQYDDLEWAASHYVQTSKAFTPETRRTALAYIEQAKHKAGSYSPIEFLAVSMRIPAFARNGHDYIDIGKGYFPDTRLPIRLLWFADGMLVARAPAQYHHLLGAQVQRIGGHTPNELVQRLRAFFGGTDEYIRWNTHWAVEAGGMLYAMGLASSSSAVALDLILADGSRLSVEIPYTASARTPFLQGHASLLTATANRDEKAAGWRSAVRSEIDPLYLQEPSALFRMQELDGANALYVQFRTHVETASGELAAFAAKVQDSLSARPPDFLLVDLRLDSGGNSDLTRQLATEMGKRTRSHIFVLTGPRTFSAGIVTAAAIKRDAKVPVSIVGETAGDAMRWWSEGSDACMPNAGYCMHVTTGLWDLSRGCKGEAHCYGDKLNANVPSLAPDLNAPITSADWLAGRDPGMDAVLAAIERKK